MSDYIIFKYRRIDKNLLKSLVNSELYFARPELLNDPFDCRVDILSSLNNAILKAKGPTKHKLVELLKLEDFMNVVKNDLIKMGVCSFSLELENTLMWSHYANDHRGVCLAYEIPKTYFDQNANEILGIVEVDYGDNPLTDWFLREALNYTNFHMFGISLIKKALSIKAKEWRYEKEVRIMRNYEGVQSIDKKFLKQLCFGLATPDSDIVLLKNIIRQSGYNTIFCKIEPNQSSDFGFITKEI